METKKQLVMVLGLNVFELLMHDGLRAKYEKAKTAEYLRVKREQFELSQIYVVDTIIDNTPVFDDNGKLLYINVPFNR